MPNRPDAHNGTYTALTYPKRSEEGEGDGSKHVRSLDEQRNDKTNPRPHHKQYQKKNSLEAVSRADHTIPYHTIPYNMTNPDDRSSDCATKVRVDGALRGSICCVELILLLLPHPPEIPNHTKDDHVAAPVHNPYQHGRQEPHHYEHRKGNACIRVSQSVSDSILMKLN